MDSVARAERDKAIVNMRRAGATLEEISQAHGITRLRVSQILRREGFKPGRIIHSESGD
jgi:DNA-directed RNA polymerase sigma subunit (sigma70/sigma32)